MSEIPENEPGIVWCKPWGEDQGEYVRVSRAEFDPLFHEVYGATAPKKTRKAK